MSKLVGFELNPDHAQMASEMPSTRKPASYTYEFTAPAIDLSTLKEAVERALKIPCLIPCLEITSASRNDSLVTLTFQFPRRLSTQERGVLHLILLSQDHPTVPHPNDDWI